MWAFISVSHTPRHSHSAVTVQLYRVIILSSAFIRDIILELTLFEKHIGIQGRVQTAPPPQRKKKNSEVKNLGRKDKNLGTDGKLLAEME